MMAHLGDTRLLFSVEGMLAGRTINVYFNLWEVDGVGRLFILFWVSLGSLCLGQSD